MVHRPGAVCTHAEKKRLPQGNHAALRKDIPADGQQAEYRH